MRFYWAENLTVVEKVVIAHLLGTKLNITVFTVICDKCGRVLADLNNIYFSSTEVGTDDYCSECYSEDLSGPSLVLEGSDFILIKKTGPFYQVQIDQTTHTLDWIVAAWITNVNNYLNDFGYPVQIPDQNPEVCSRWYSTETKSNLVVFLASYNARHFGLNSNDSEELVEINPESDPGFKPFLSKGYEKIFYRDIGDGSGSLEIVGISDQIAKCYLNHYKLDP